MIKAVTFDFWDTLAIDDSDEPKRKNLGLLSKSGAREQLFLDEIGRVHPQLSPEKVREAFKFANEKFQMQWKTQHKTPTVQDRFLELYLHLKIKPTPNFGKIVNEIESMETEIPPDCVSFALETLEILAKRYKLCLISDTIHTPGRGIRKLLAHWGLDHLFSGLVFSDEVGASKPDPIVFRRASEILNVPLNEMIHVGDRESNDVTGPMALGMKAILFTGVIDRGSMSSYASALCKDLRDLPKIIDKFN